ncbi:choice-of-anchor L domain-containing protein, partial [Candidatus Ulvibacter alkanivorans]|uniref:choice-of-anchor L domain-containing protein n=1 Tax=Candidatus Ulvibacter alkanivorans TaxID=2267620 RepID=UPI001B352E21
MKKFLLPIFFLFSCIGFSQIVVDDTFTVQELVEDVLINSPCAQVSNFNSDTGSVNNGIGFFDGNGSSFPFQSGVVLSTGAATEAEGPNDQGGFQSEDTDAPADPDLDAAIPTTDARQDRTFIEFDFVPQISTISFNFLFASEEYEGSFQCTFTDAFAFLLFDPSGGVQNLAVLPGVPPPNNIVSVTNVHPDVPGSCGPMNEQFFGQYNDGANAPTSPIQFNGQTVVLTAQGNVIPGETYRIKLVIADDRDGVYDSAVFLEAGSFNIGVDLGPDATISNGNAPCEGEEFEIGLINPAPGESYRWFVFNPGTGMFDLIPGEFASTLTVTQNGTYQIEVTSITGCAATDDIVVEFAPQPTAAVPDPLEACDEAPNDGFTEFDLTLRDVQIQNGEPNTTVSYYVTEAEAEAGFNAILNPTTFQNSTINTQTVYARLEESNFGCYDVVPLFLIVNQSPEISDPISDYFICDNDQDGFEEFDLTSKDSEILGTLVNVDLTYHTSQADAEGGVGAIMPAN